MSGYSPALPLALTSQGGYLLLQDVKATVVQNFKMLVLTSPGERIMDPQFGVGLYNFLFANATSLTKSTIETRIAQQVRKYMPFIKIMSVVFDDPGDSPEFGFLDYNYLGVEIKYFIIPLNSPDILRISVGR